MKKFLMIMVIFIVIIFLKVLKEGLNEYFNVKYLVRKSKKKGGQIINLPNIYSASNILSFISNLLKTFKTNSKYLIISITPYTFIAYLFLLIFRKESLFIFVE